ncbi:MAG: DUF1223 domain-containing protein [Boseongicola sp.]|nr:MAG: DUF1223 domain-containing protein [Boseongicola sp.]
MSAIITAVWAGFSELAVAESPVVVELYTSQGCSSCPPADKLLGEIAQRDDVIALALHVDYWDYIGWKDEFADPAHTVRQRGYSHAAGKRTIYTPQMVIGGRDHVVGSRPMKVFELLEDHWKTPYAADVRLERNGNRVTVRISAESGMPSGGALVQLATFREKETVDIRRGENRGRTLTYHNVVGQMIEIGEWNGRGTYRASIQVPATTPIAVLVQQPNYGPMLGAAQLK